MKIKSKSGQYFEIFLKRNSGEESIICPACSQDRKKKTIKCLSWNHDKQIGHCAHCDEAFYIEKEKKKEYFLPVPKLQKVSDKTLQWFQGRGISNNTLLRFKVTESKEFMSQVNSERNCICFNYFRDEKLINIKYRDGAKNFKLVKDAELIFYNLDSIKDEKECVIVEGEIDCLSMYEAGIFNSVSVPNGANKGSRLDYLDNCIDYFLGKEKIIIATDNDAAGIVLRDELIRRLGKEICWIVEYPANCKDANDVLKTGIENLKELINSAYQLPIEGIEQAKDIDDELMQIFRNGYPVGDKVSYHDLDDHITYRKGEFTVITGTPGAGKSTFLNNLLVKLANRNEWRIAIFSPEKQPNAILSAEIAEIFIGKQFFSYNNLFVMGLKELQASKDFINEYFWFMKIDEIDVTIDGILDKCRELVVRNGVNCLVIDPYNYIEHKIPNGQTETQYISELLSKIKRFKDRYTVHVFLVAHPRKLQKKDGKYEVPTLYDISGSANFFNKCDNGIVVYRNFSENTTDVHIQKIRWSFIGKIGEVKFTYNPQNKKFTELNAEDKSEYHYSIDKKELVPF